MTRRDAPLVAIVRMRKRDHWVLPKGKLDAGETARDAAEREVMEETGHDVAVHEFVGTMAYEVRGRPKIVHFWRMEAEIEPAHDLMRDVRAVAWLPLEEAIAQLTRGYEQAFLAEIGPAVLAMADAMRFDRAEPEVIAAPPSVPAQDAGAAVDEVALASRSAPVAPPLRPAFAAAPATTATPSRRPWFAWLWRWFSRED
ncbi:MAG: NUDIX domain-containing protein [Xanthobacteraceae bacterium]|nr:NUDIX domain-containing protein [Xanthobacteraceae bacterium]